MRRTIARELMDEPVDDAGELEANLRDIEFANRAWAEPRPSCARCAALGARRVLDVGSGAGDVALALVRDGAGAASKCT